MSSLSEALAPAGGPHIGDLVWWSLGTGRIPVGTLRTAWTGAGVDPSYLPEDPTDERAFREAGKLPGQDGILLRRAPDPMDRPAWGIVREHASAKLDYSHDATVILLPDGTIDVPADPVAAQIAERYAALRGTLSSDDLRRAIVRVLDACSAALVRPAGGVYWIAPQHAATVRGLASACNSIPGARFDLLPVHKSPEAVASLAAPAAAGIEADLASLRAEIASLAGEKPRAGTLARRLEAIDAIEAKATLYRSVLSVEIADLDAALAEMEREVNRQINENGGKA